MTMTQGFRLEEPPVPSGGPRGKFDVDEAIDFLSDHPGEWAVLAEGVSQSYAHTSGKVQTLKDKGCEIRSAKVDGEYVVYGRLKPATRSSRRAA